MIKNSNDFNDCTYDWEIISLLISLFLLCFGFVQSFSENLGTETPQQSRVCTLLDACLDTEFCRGLSSSDWSVVSTIPTSQRLKVPGSVGKEDELSQG